MSVIAKDIQAVTRDLKARDVNMDYDKRMSETTRLLGSLNKQLMRHSDRQRRNPTEATYLEDLDKLNQNLNIAMRELG